MSLDNDQRERLYAMLRGTRDRELDCDEFAAMVSTWIDGGLESEELEALMQHHQDICGECAEGHLLLRRALGLDEPACG